MQYLKFYKVMRAPLEFPNGPKVHWGFAVQNTYTNETLVLHNTPERNVHVGDLQEFHSGLEWGHEAIPFREEVYNRFLAAAQDKRQYDLLTNNCQRTFTGIVDGFSWTPAVWLLALIVAGAIALYAAKGQGGGGAYFVS